MLLVILLWDGQTDKVEPVYPPSNFIEAGGIITGTEAEY